MSDQICIGMFRPKLEDVPRYDSHRVHASWYSMGGALLNWNHPDIVKHWQLGHWDTPVYASREEVLEKMAKLELASKTLPSSDSPPQ